MPNDLSLFKGNPLSEIDRKTLQRKKNPPNDLETIKSTVNSSLEQGIDLKKILHATELTFYHLIAAPIYSLVEDLFKKTQEKYLVVYQDQKPAQMTPELQIQHLPTVIFFTVVSLMLQKSKQGKLSDQETQALLTIAWDFFRQDASTNDQMQAFAMKEMPNNASSDFHFCCDLLLFSLQINQFISSYNFQFQNNNPCRLLTPEKFDIPSLRNLESLMNKLSSSLPTNILQQSHELALLLIEMNYILVQTILVLLVKEINNSLLNINDIPLSRIIEKDKTCRKISTLGTIILTFSNQLQPKPASPPPKYSIIMEILPSSLKHLQDSCVTTTELLLKAQTDKKKLLENLILSDTLEEKLEKMKKTFNLILSQVRDLELGAPLNGLICSNSYASTENQRTQSIKDTIENLSSSLIQNTPKSKSLFALIILYANLCNTLQIFIYWIVSNDPKLPTSFSEEIKLLVKQYQIVKDKNNKNYPAEYLALKYILFFIAANFSPIHDNKLSGKKKDMLLDFIWKNFSSKTNALDETPPENFNQFASNKSKQKPYLLLTASSYLSGFLDTTTSLPKQEELEKQVNSRTLAHLKQFNQLTKQLLEADFWSDETENFSIVFLDGVHCVLDQLHKPLVKKILQLKSIDVESKLLYQNFCATLSEAITNIQKYIDSISSKVTLKIATLGKSEEDIEVLPKKLSLDKLDDYKADLQMIISDCSQALTHLENLPTVVVNQKQQKELKNTAQDSTPANQPPSSSQLVFQTPQQKTIHITVGKELQIKDTSPTSNPKIGTISVLEDVLKGVVASITNDVSHQFRIDLSSSNTTSNPAEIQNLTTIQEELQKIPFEQLAEHFTSNQEKYRKMLGNVKEITELYLKESNTNAAEKFTAKASQLEAEMFYTFVRALAFKEDGPFLSSYQTYFNQTNNPQIDKSKLPAEEALALKKVSIYFSAAYIAIYFITCQKPKYTNDQEISFILKALWQYFYSDQNKEIETILPTDYTNLVTTAPHSKVFKFVWQVFTAAIYLRRVFDLQSQSANLSKKELPAHYATVIQNTQAIIAEILKYKDLLDDEKILLTTCAIFLDYTTPTISYFKQLLESFKQLQNVHSAKIPEKLAFCQNLSAMNVLLLRLLESISTKILRTDLDNTKKIKDFTDQIQQLEKTCQGTAAYLISLSSNSKKNQKPKDKKKKPKQQKTNPNKEVPSSSTPENSEPPVSSVETSETTVDDKSDQNQAPNTDQSGIKPIEDGAIIPAIETPSESNESILPQQSKTAEPSDSAPKETDQHPPKTDINSQVSASSSNKEATTDLQPLIDALASSHPPSFFAQQTTQNRQKEDRTKAINNKRNSTFEEYNSAINPVQDNKYGSEKPTDENKSPSPGKATRYKINFIKQTEQKYLDELKQKRDKANINADNLKTTEPATIKGTQNPIAGLKTAVEGTQQILKKQMEKPQKTEEEVKQSLQKTQWTLKQVKADPSNLEVDGMVTNLLAQQTQATKQYIDQQMKILIKKMLEFQKLAALNTPTAAITIIEQIEIIQGELETLRKTYIDSGFSSTEQLQRALSFDMSEKPQPPPESLSFKK